MKKGKNNSKNNKQKSKGKNILIVWKLKASINKLINTFLLFEDFKPSVF